MISTVRNTAALLLFLSILTALKPFTKHFDLIATRISLLQAMPKKPNKLQKGVPAHVIPLLKDFPYSKDIVQPSNGHVLSLFLINNCIGIKTGRDILSKFPQQVEEVNKFAYETLIICRVTTLVKEIKKLCKHFSETVTKIKEVLSTLFNLSPSKRPPKIPSSSKILAVPTEPSNSKNKIVKRKKCNLCEHIRKLYTSRCERGKLTAKKLVEEVKKEYSCQAVDKRIDQIRKDYQQKEMDLEKRQKETIDSYQEKLTTLRNYHDITVEQVYYLELEVKELKDKIAKLESNKQKLEENETSDMDQQSAPVLCLNSLYGDRQKPLVLEFEMEDFSS